PRARSGAPFDHYSLLRTIEDGLGLGRLGASASARPLTAPPPALAGDGSAWWLPPRRGRRGRGSSRLPSSDFGRWIRAQPPQHPAPTGRPRLQVDPRRRG